MGRKPKVVKELVLPTMKKDELIDYIKDQHRLFTMSEIAEFTGFSYQQVKTACENNGYCPITLGERVKEYVECNMHLTIVEQAEKLDMSVESLKYYYKQFDYNHKKAGKGQRLPPSSVRVKRAIKELGSIPLDVLMGPIARKYNTEENPLDTINKARTRLLSR